METHVNHWLWETIPPHGPEGRNERYARWMLMHFRLPAIQQHAYSDFLEGKRLYCTFEGVRYRVTGASRSGDIYLTRDFDQCISGYAKRGVFVDQVTDWSPIP